MKFIVLMFLFSSFTFAGDKVEKIKEIQSAGMTKIVIDLSGNLNSNPEIVRTKTSINVSIPGVDLAKKSTIHINPAHGIQVKDTNGGVELIVPRSIIKKTANSDISIQVSKKKLTATFPLKALKKVVTKKITPKKELKVAKIAAAPEKSSLDYLIEDFRRNSDKQEKIPFNDEKITSLLEDKVETKLTAQAKPVVGTVENVNSESLKIENLSNETKGFQGYLVKLILVLVGIIGAFLLVMNLFRKKVLGKSKLGFLNNNKLVEVVGTTHISPKKNLLLVRVHEQYVLLSNTEGAINFLTDIKDQAGLLRMGEQEAHGTNFDGNLSVSNAEPATTVIEKKNIYESTPMTNKKTSFSKHLKRKLGKSRSAENRA